MLWLLVFVDLGAETGGRDDDLLFRVPPPPGVASGIQEVGRDGRREGERAGSSKQGPRLTPLPPQHPAPVPGT